MLRVKKDASDEMMMVGVDIRDDDLLLVEPSKAVPDSRIVFAMTNE